MVKKSIFFFVLLAFSVSLLFSSSFEEEKIKTADGENFIFPSDAYRDGPVVFALTLGKDRSNGEVQQQTVIAWQQYFNENPNTLGNIPVYHFSVLSGVPFFVKGTIRKALYENYAVVADPSKVGVLFVSKTEKFAEQAGIPFDEESTLVVVESDGTIAGYVKGPVTPGKVEQLKVLATL